MSKLAAKLVSAQKSSTPGASGSLDAELSALVDVPRKNVGKVAPLSGFGPAFHGLLTDREADLVLRKSKWPFYVYALCTHTGAAFYIGKGTGRRMFAHKEEADAGIQSAKCDMIRLAGNRLRYSIHLMCSDEAYAYGVEAMLINQNYDDLTNINPGPLADYLGLMFDVSPEEKASIILADTMASIAEMEAGMLRAAKTMAARCSVTKRLLADEGFPV